MKEFNFKNLEKDIICNDFIIENGEISKLNINEETYNIHQIPSLENGDYKIYILQKNMCDYIIVKNYNDHIEFTFKIMQDVINNKAKIIDIYFHMYISSLNSLSPIFELSKQSASHIYKNYLPYFLTFLPYSNKEIDWYKEEINNLINNLNVVKQNVPLKTYKNDKKKKNYQTYFIDGVEYANLKEVAKAYNLANSTLWGRLDKGMSLEEAVTKPLVFTGKRARKVYDKKG